MSFSKFKLDSSNVRSAPLNIAPAPVMVPKYPAGSNSKVTKNISTKSSGKKNKPKPNEAQQKCILCKGARARCYFNDPTAGFPCARCERLERVCIRDREHAEKLFEEMTAPPSPKVPDVLPAAEANPATAAQWPDPNHLSLENTQLQNTLSSLISWDGAQKVLHYFIDRFLPACPVVAFPVGQPVEVLYEKKPMLFLSILGVASSRFCSVDKHRALVQEARRIITERAIIRGEKSLELVQALQVTTFWYRAPEDYKRINFNQLAGAMITMTIDMDLESLESAQAVNGNDAWELSEVQRALLACFIMSESISSILRRPKLISWSNRLKECMDGLQKTKMSPLDPFLCMLVKAELGCQVDDGRQFSGLALTKEDIGPVNNVQKAAVDFHLGAAIVYNNESAMRIDNNPKEFAAPFTMNSLQTCLSLDENTGDGDFAILHQLIQGYCNLLKAFLKLSHDDMLTLPPHIYGGRVIWSLVILCKLYKAVVNAKPEMAERLLAVNHVETGRWLESFMSVCRELLMRDDRNSLGRSLLIVEELAKWYCNGNYMAVDYKIQDGMTVGKSPVDEQEETNSTSVVPANGDEMLFPATAGTQDWYFDDFIDMEMYN